MTYDPNIHHRRSIRLKGYDYAQAGLYFITVCVQNRACLLGEIQNGVMVLNDAGKMVERWYAELENKYPDKRCHEMVVMPNHFHCIIENIWDGCDARMDVNNTEMVGDDAQWNAHDEQRDANDDQWDAHVGAPLRGRPMNDERITDERGRSANNDNDHAIAGQYAVYGYDNKKHHATIGDVMDWFKTMTTNEYIRGVKKLGWPPFDRKLWQRNYYEHIIRDEQSYERIAEYIISNPAKWQVDKLFGV
jgi:putative transposase